MVIGGLKKENNIRNLNGREHRPRHRVNASWRTDIDI